MTTHNTQQTETQTEPSPAALAANDQIKIHTPIGTLTGTVQTIYRNEPTQTVSGINSGEALIDVTLETVCVEANPEVPSDHLTLEVAEIKPGNWSKYTANITDNTTDENGLVIEKDQKTLGNVTIERA